MIKKYCVYKHTCPNGKVYVGITSNNPLVRWKNGKGYVDQYFYKAILKYGWDNIKHEILFTGLSEREACEKEIELIAKYKSNNSKFGYNVSLGGETGNGGITFTEETKKKISKSLTGKTHSQITKNKMSVSQKERFSKQPKKHLSDETKRKMSLSRIGKPSPNKSKFGKDNKTSKPVMQINKSGVVVKMYAGVSDATRITKINHTSIIKCCNGQRKTAGGFVWRYLNDC